LALKKTHLEQLTARMGLDKVLSGEADLAVHSTDIGSPPGIIDLLVKRNAEAVVRCHDIDDVQTTIRFCLKRRIPMTPRASATNALGGAVPKRGGVVLDLTAMAKSINIDEANLKVTVDAGVVIRDLQEKLLEVGLEMPCYPTSANAATIGGFVAMDGHGINSTSNGNIRRHVVAIEGVGMDGEKFAEREAEDIAMISGLGGSTGIMTRITLRVVEARPEKPVAISTSSLTALQAIIQEVTARFAPKHVMFHNGDFFALRSEAVGDRKAPFAGKHAAIIAFAESDMGRIQGDLDLLVKRHGGELAPEALAKAEWDGRFFPIRAKRIGPSIVAGETYVPLEHAATYIKRLKLQVAVKHLSVEGHLTDDGRVYFFIFALDDERRTTYPLGWGTSARILKEAKKLGGSAYHCGVWLQGQAKDVFGKSRYKLLKQLKRGGDRRHLMNPGMCFPYPAPVPSFLFSLPVLGPIPGPSLGFQLKAGDPILILQDKAVTYRRHKSLGVLAADVAADSVRGGVDFGIHSNAIWGCDLASVQAIPNPGLLPMTQTMRGKMVLAKLYAQGKIADPWTMKAALDVADPVADDVKALCPDIDEVLAITDSLRRAVQSEGVSLDVQAVEVAVEVTADVGADAGTPESGLDIAAIKEQAKNTPEVEKAWVLAADCIVCNGCEAACPTDAAIVTDTARVDRDLCIADGACFDACPTDAIRPGIEDESSSGGWPEGSRLAGKFGV
jgi:FAD/FMN-containing dehydrogenase/ferredoxin